MLRVNLARRLRESRDGTARPLPLGQQVNASTCEASETQRLLTRLRETDSGHAPKPKIAASPASDNSQHPAFRARGIDDEIEAVPVSVAAWFLDAPNLHARQSFVRMATARLPSLLLYVPHNNPYSTPDLVGRPGTLRDDSRLNLRLFYVLFGPYWTVLELG